MSQEPKPRRLSSVSALLVSVLVAGLLGLATGSKVDDLLSPSLGSSGGTAVGVAVALVVLVSVGVLSYRGLTR